jgi:hypothetical protein
MTKPQEGVGDSDDKPEVTLTARNEKEGCDVSQSANKETLPSVDPDMAYS